MRTPLLLFMALTVPSQFCLGLDLYVAPTGHNEWSGRCAEVSAERTDGPFATLERARDEIRRIKRQGSLPAGGVTVRILGGDYFLNDTFELADEDSGTVEAPVVYRAHSDERTRLIGGRQITNFKPVSDPLIRQRLDTSARAHVRMADLKALGITDYGDAVAAGKRFELFFQERPMTLARWPDDGFIKIVEVVGQKPHSIHGLKGNKEGKFTYEGDRPKRWIGEDDIRLHGFWFWDWSDAYQKVKAIDTEQRIISTVPPYHHYGYRAGQRYYVLNVLSELDSPGEWYLDRKAGALYFWPPADIDSNHAYVSMLDTMIAMQNVSYVILRGLSLSFNRGTAIVITGGSHNRIAGCRLSNIGGSAVVVRGGEGNQVVGCDIDNIGDSGISLQGGDRKTLTPCGHAAINNHIHHYSRTSRTYRTAVNVSGVGCRVAHNLIHDAPHMALGLNGNDHVIEFNEIHHVCTETDDAGAFYMGRDWTWRGNAIRYNYFHHIGQFKTHVGTQAIYLDDWASGTTVFGNVCYKVFRAVLVGGGRNNTIENNIFVDCDIAVHVDSRGLGWAKNYFDSTTNTLTERLAAVPYKTPPWSTRYPELLTLYDDEPALAKYNKIVRNIAVNNKKWIDLHNGLTDKVVRIEDNLVDVDPHFVDAEHQDFRLKTDSPALAKGFKPIPCDKIGLYVDEFRQKLPGAKAVADDQKPGVPTTRPGVKMPLKVDFEHFRIVEWGIGHDLELPLFVPDDKSTFLKPRNDGGNWTPFHWEKSTRSRSGHSLAIYLVNPSPDIRGCGADLWLQGKYALPPDRDITVSVWTNCTRQDKDFTTVVLGWQPADFEGTMGGIQEYVKFNERRNETGWKLQTLTFRSHRDPEVGDVIGLAFAGRTKRKTEFRSDPPAQNGEAGDEIVAVQPTLGATFDDLTISVAK